MLTACRSTCWLFCTFIWMARLLAFLFPIAVGPNRRHGEHRQHGQFTQQQGNPMFIHETDQALMGWLDLLVAAPSRS